jgi:hypothetical protein
LHREDCQEDQAASQPARPGQAFAEKHGGREGCEHRLGGEDNRRVRGARMPLGNRLQGEGQPPDSAPAKNSSGTVRQIACALTGSIAKASASAASPPAAD